MTRDKQRLLDYLAHIMEAIERINSYIYTIDKSAFLANALIQDAVVRNFEILGEASHHIEKQYPEFASAHPELPLSHAYQMRNAIAHGYFKVDYEIVWNTIQNALPDLRHHVKKVIDELPDDNNAPEMKH